MRYILARLREYTDNPDPLANVAGKVALVVASNLPFYPLYLHWIAGKSAWPAWLALLTVPGFAAVPFVAKRNSLAGRALLPLVGVLNTVICTKVLGVKTGVELFLLPCILLSAILFRPTERLIGFPLIALSFAAYLLDGYFGSALQSYSEDGLGSMIALNAMSVASLTALIGILFSTATQAGPPAPIRNHD